MKAEIPDQAVSLSSCQPSGVDLRSVSLVWHGLERDGVATGTR